ncbi:MAG: sulfotransferase [Pseudomonadota bacterium]|nr:sulfotransferase [Pseudomonadota bacterium]
MDPQMIIGSKIIFHIGYPKAGSTTLQRALFNSHPKLINLGLNPKKNVAEVHSQQNANENIVPIDVDPCIADLNHILCNLDGVLLDEKLLINKWKSISDKYGRSSKQLIVSNESFLSTRFSNPEVIEKIRRIKLIEPNAKIIVVIRSQYKILMSLYRDQPFDPRMLRAKNKHVSFDEYFNIEINSPIHSSINSLHYFKLWKHLTANFGRENVLMLPLELLELDPESFCEKLGAFLGIDSASVAERLVGRRENSGVAGDTGKYRSLRRKFSVLLGQRPALKRAARSIDQLIMRCLGKYNKPKKIDISDRHKTMFKKIYSEGNSALSIELNVDLNELGYPC